MKKNCTKVIEVLLFLLVPIVITFFYIKSQNDDFLNLILIVFFIIIGVLISIIGLLKISSTKRPIFFYFGVYIIIVCIASYFIRCGFIDYENSVTAANSKTIINSIERYYNDNKQYPKEMKDLKPKYLAVIPKRCHYFKQDTQFEYGIETPGVYYLAYDIEERVPMFYYSDKKIWVPHPKG